MCFIDSQKGEVVVGMKLAEDLVMVVTVVVVVVVVVVVTSGPNREHSVIDGRGGGGY